MHIAFMKRLSLQDPVQKKTVFRYWDKYFKGFLNVFDSPTFAYDDNTKVVVVDGPPAVGKSKLCEALAKEFGLLYMPAPTHDEIYINPYGDDLRQLDAKLPFQCRSYDLKDFLTNPKDERVPFFQMLFLEMRFEQYANALLHLLSTGQGVVLNRCIYSDIVFAKAMLQNGFISDHVMAEYNYRRNILNNSLLKPHLIIYLDVPPELVKEKIKKKGNPHEVNSEVFTTKYLSNLETAYKNEYLKPLQKDAQLLVYDWSTEGNIQDVIYDIEKLDFTIIEDVQFKDWVFPTSAEVADHIFLYQDKWQIYCDIFANMEVPPRELYWSAEEYNEFETAMESIPSEKYDYGYNPYTKNNLFRENKPRLFLIRRSPRDFVNRDDSMF